MFDYSTIRLASFFVPEDRPPQTLAVRGGFFIAVPTAVMLPAAAMGCGTWDVSPYVKQTAKKPGQGVDSPPRLSVCFQV